MVLPVRIAGHDANGKAFSQLAHTLDFSRMGARLGGVEASLRIGDEITIDYKGRHGRFIVRWVAADRKQGGLENLDPGKFVFFDLPEDTYVDDVDESRVRRKAIQPISAPTTPPTTAASGAQASGDRAAEPAPAKTVPNILGAPVLPMAAADKLAVLKYKLWEGINDTDGGLQLVAAAARELLPASGAAVAVVAGEDWICRASAGVAPRIGLHFQAPEGLTGEAAVSGQVVICSDTEEDPRLNSSIWRSVHLRSAASVPIMRKTNALGVLEVFAEQPNAFGDQHGGLLRELGELLAELISAASTTNT
ncbi:MAG: GAF domain-containing protein [Acidobacteriia bacterium]|nr:GAF domain-containing protein [Terriglobia bacterium]